MLKLKNRFFVFLTWCVVLACTLSFNQVQALADSSKGKAKGKTKVNISISKKLDVSKFIKITVEGLKAEYKEGENISFRVFTINSYKNLTCRVELYNQQDKTTKIISSKSNKFLGKFYLSYTLPKLGIGKYTIRASAFTSENKKYVSQVYTKQFSVVSKDCYGMKITTPNTIVSDKTIKGNVYIQATGVKLQNVSVKGTITIDSGINSTVSMENVTADYVKVIKSSPTNISLYNVKILKQLYVKADDNQKTMIEINNLTNINSTIVYSNVTLDNKAGDFGKVYFKKYKNSVCMADLKGIYQKDISIEVQTILTTDSTTKISLIKVNADVQIYVDKYALIMSVDNYNGKNVILSGEGAGNVKINKRQIVVDKIDNINLVKGEVKDVNVKADPGDVQINVTSSNINAVTAFANGKSIRLIAANAGSSVITVYISKSGYENITIQFTVSVEGNKTEAGILTLNQYFLQYGTTQSLLLSYTLGENYTNGSISFVLPDGISPLATDVVSIAGQGSVSIGSNCINGQVVTINGITAAKGQTITLLLQNRIFNSNTASYYMFCSYGDADGAGVDKSQSQGTENEVKFLSVLR